MKAASELLRLQTNSHALPRSILLTRLKFTCVRKQKFSYRGPVRTRPRAQQKRRWIWASLQHFIRLISSQGVRSPLTITTPKNETARLLCHTPRYACAQPFHLGSEKWKRPAVNVCCILVFTTRLLKNAFSWNITSFSGITFSSSIKFSKNLLSQLGPSQSPSHRHL